MQNRLTSEEFDQVSDSADKMWYAIDEIVEVCYAAGIDVPKKVYDIVQQVADIKTLMFEMSEDYVTVSSRIDSINH